MDRRTYLSTTLGILGAIAGCTEDSASGGTTTKEKQSELVLTDASVIEYKPKDIYEDRPKVAGSLEVTIANRGSEALVVDALRITGDIPNPHDETNTGVFSIPSKDVIEKVEVEPNQSQQCIIQSNPFYYVDLSSEGKRSQEELNETTCNGETKSATLHFSTENRGTFDREIQLRFEGETVEFDEMAPDYGCTNVTVSLENSQG